MEDWYEWGRMTEIEELRARVDELTNRLDLNCKTLDIILSACEVQDQSIKGLARAVFGEEVFDNALKTVKEMHENKN